MGRPLKESTKAPGQRSNLPRARKRVHFDFRWEMYHRLVALQLVGPDGVPEPIISVVERLVASAAEVTRLPFEKNEFVGGRHHNVASRRK